MFQLDCSICSEDFKDPCCLPCGHSFCRVCITKSLTRSSTCPLCRFPSSMNQICSNYQLAEVIQNLAHIPTSSALRQVLREQSAVIHELIATINEHKEQTAQIGSEIAAIKLLSKENTMNQRQLHDNFEIELNNELSNIKIVLNSQAEAHSQQIDSLKSLFIEKKGRGSVRRKVEELGKFSLGIIVGFVTALKYLDSNRLFQFLLTSSVVVFKCALLFFGSSISALNNIIKCLYRNSCIETTRSQ
ncbi:hypothetical protein RCL1_007694 [Eukaryota sp. TZLM3-RCL]